MAHWQAFSGDSGRRGQLFACNLAVKPGTDGHEASFSPKLANHVCSISIAFPLRLHDVKDQVDPSVTSKAQAKRTPIQTFHNTHCGLARERDWVHSPQ
ncbi:uncharacterized protein BO96DRAFT_8175 [Aspergillus niger CBS 101883]|uniref:uncharacterized protein n=1 Tax=Aspergillus lacticoffeatus (strain CBS 101883) TaxID=1450533 RepID=UPI000D7ED4C5|nr:uncharacterized protein BO96DRAFT_8175 [Aspergillus niger CBS 101883]PYH62117.1 hypothetical protein BO96DRAFT_8175 [Aspergillus niger CBS 101883]